MDAPEFYYAEDYHQQYLAKNPNGYCGLGGTGVSCPVGLKASQQVGRALEAFVRLGRPVGGLSRPPGPLVVLGVRNRLAVARHGGHADEHVEPVRRQADECLDGELVGAQPPLLVKLARERVRRALAEVDGAARPEGPPARPARHPAGAAAGQPAAVR